MEIPVLIVPMISLVLFLLGTGTFLYIRRAYRIFCQKEDQKERINILKQKINSAKDYLRQNYSTAFDHSIPDNIIPKMEFLVKLISHRTLEDQEKNLYLLLNILTETFIRLKQNPQDPILIISPLNSLRDKLVQEHLNFIKENMTNDF